MNRHVLAAVLVFAGACSTGEKDEPQDGGHEPGRAPTGSTCPTNSTVTYENFARGFMTSYCVRCHSSTLAGAARNGAPAFHDFDTEQGILDVAGHVDEMAAAGPNAVNTSMPKDGAQPTAEERRMLGEWIACELAGGAGSDAGHHEEGDGGH